MILKRCWPLWFLSFFLLISCAATIYNLTKTQYINDSFSAAILNEGGLALLPITAGAGQEGYRRPLGDSLNVHLNNSVPFGEVIKWQESMELLNAHDKVIAYQELIEAYNKTSILSRDKVKEIKTALNVRFALYCTLQDISESSNINYNPITGFNRIKTANVIAQCLVFDLETGDIMQEIIGHAKSIAGEYSYNQEYEAYAGNIARAILSQLPGSMVIQKITPKPNFDSHLD